MPAAKDVAEEDHDNTLRRCVITGLSSGITYEFKVAGYNECGIGDWTKISEPICSRKLHSKLSSGPPPTRRSLVVESPHPYRPCMDVKESVLLTGCKYGARVEFHKKTKLEMDADVLCFYEDETFDDVLSARAEDGDDEINCVFDGEYRLSPEEFPVLVEVCRESQGHGELNIDKKFCYGFFSDEQNEYWGYKFTLTWDDYTESEEWEQNIAAAKLARSKQSGKWLSDIKDVKELQVKEEKDAEEAKLRALEIRKKLIGTIIINGKETVRPVSQITPRFMDGTENRLVAPVRKQQLPLFPSFGNRGDDMDGDGKKDTGFDENGMLVANATVDDSGVEDEDDEIEGSLGGILTTTPTSSKGRKVLHLLASDNIEEAWREDAVRSRAAILNQPDIVGCPDQRQVHYLKLKSAYRGYCAAGEPLYTSVGNHGAVASDFILASEETLACVDVLSIPVLGWSDRENHAIATDAREAELTADMNYDLDGWDDIYQEMMEQDLERRAKMLEDEDTRREEEALQEKERLAKIAEAELAAAAKERKMRRGGVKKGKVFNKPEVKREPKKEKRKYYKKKPPYSTYRGSFQPFVRPNALAEHSIIPNAIHPSNHFPIMATFRFVLSHMPALWHGGQEESDAEDEK